MLARAAFLNTQQEGITMVTVISINGSTPKDSFQISVLNLLNLFLNLSEKYKNSYFWHGNWDADERTRREDNDALSFVLDVNGEKVEADFSVSYSRHYVSVSKNIYVDGKRKDIRVLKKVLGMLEEEIKAPLDAAAAASTKERDLIALARDPHVEVFRALVSRDYLPKKVLVVLANRAEALCRRYAAGNRDTPPAILKKLSKDADESVRGCVACNCAAPESILKRLAKDNDPHVRRLVANNENTADQDLCRLAADPDSEVRLAIARRSGAPSDVLLKLSSDEDKEIRLSIARRKDAPSDVLLKLSEDKDKEIRLTVAGNESTPTQALEYLSKARGKYIPLAVARNSAISNDLLLQLTAHQIADVREAAKGVLRSRDAADYE